MLCWSLYRKFRGRIGKMVAVLCIVYIAAQIAFLSTTKVPPFSQGSLSTSNGTGESMATRPMSPSKRVDVGQIINPPFKVLMYGQPRGHKGLFTIGIPSAQRPNTDRIYLFDTVDSIIDKTTESEKEEVTLVLMLCDLNSTYNTHISVNVYNTYQQHVESGFIQIIHTQRSIYPDLEHVKPTFNDTKDRLKWRAKQNVDFSFLMHYSINISEYYIQLEDDVIVASDFVNSIKSHLSISTAWAVLEFSRLGFIGKMFKSSDLEYVASKLMLRYDEAPCDLLLSPIRMDLGQKKSIHSKQSLFQHIGRFSSLKNKLMPSIDNKFKDNANVTFDLYNYPAADDPEASFQTTFETYLNFTTEFAYDNNASSFFWGKTPKKGDTFTLVLAMPQNLTRIVVLTGKKETRNDNLLYTDLECSTFQFGSSETDECGTMFIKLTGLADGDADTLATGTAIPNNVKCLRLRVKRKLRTWVVIREILLYT